MIEMMIAAPASGSGKTVVACGMLAMFKRMKRRVCAFKCGPDYIDPMFHRSVLGVESHNLDLFLAGRASVEAMYGRYSAGHDVSVCEGVMGYYDGVAGTTACASAWHLADTLGLPTVLVMSPKGASLSLAAQIKGMCSLRQPHHIVGVIFNKCAPMMFRAMAETLERESGVPVLGYLPPMEEAVFESRHLGLYTAGEIDDLSHRIEKIAMQLKKSVDVERLIELCTSERRERKSGETGLKNHKAGDTALEFNESGTTALPEHEAKDIAMSVHEVRKTAIAANKTGRTLIAVARDEAFCFAYEETIDALKEAGAEIIYFSPLQDDSLPDGAGGLYLPGGYPELYAAELSKNEAMRVAIRNAVKCGMPTVAECGGFLYLGQKLQGSDGVMYPMAEALEGDGVKKDRLVRFGYAELTARSDSMLLRAGEKTRVHEFHYWDSTQNGDSFEAVKPVSGRRWQCGIAGDTIYAGFPHLYFAGDRKLSQRFVRAASEYSGGAGI